MHERRGRILCKFFLRGAAIAALLWATMPREARPEAMPHRSYFMLPFSNGFSPVVYDIGRRRINVFADHLYKDYDGRTPSTDLCWDTYWGLNVAGEGASWMTEIPEISVGYEEGTGIVAVVREFGGLRIEEFYFSPFDFAGSILVMLAKVTNESATPKVASLWSLHNFHVGAGAPEAGFDREAISWQRGGFVEVGTATGHTFVIRPIHLPSHRRTDQGSSPGNPYLLIADPSLEDRDSTGGPVSDAVGAFQWYLGVGGFLNPEESQWEGVVIAYGKGVDPAILSDEVTSWIRGREPHEILEEERRGWQEWLDSGVPLASLISNPDRLRLARHSIVMLRMGQVREPNSTYGKPRGQIVASMPPGMWNITWPRDQAYAVAALVEAGKMTEAKEAIEFIFNGEVGAYADYVGTSNYLVSVCRYYGGGFEESDGDPAAEGPNIEFDNFGLFLWSLGRYVAASGDTEIVSTHSNSIFERVADVLVSLIEPTTGLIKADSSIWERHWNGNQKHFAYSSIMAVAGLCAAASMALEIGDSERGRNYISAARRIYHGIMNNLVVDGGSFIAQSLEEIPGGRFVDASVVEALILGLVEPNDPLFTSVLARLRRDLWLPITDRGYKRNDDGDWYDEQEWVFIDLRIALAARTGGNTWHYDELVDWITHQSLANNGLIAELYDNVTADYRGAVPMMGFGAGAYLLALLASPADYSVQECLRGEMPQPVEDEREELEAEEEEDEVEVETEVEEVEPAVDATTDVTDIVTEPSEDTTPTLQAKGGAGCSCQAVD